MLLLRDDKGSVFYLLEGKEYLIGRKYAEIAINDVSVSRKHAIISVNNGIVKLQDCVSKYGTYINEEQLECGTSTNINIGDRLTFGSLDRVYKLEEICLKVTYSGLHSEQKKLLLQKLKYLGATVSPTWSADCTHVTVRDVKLTAKILCAITSGCPIITLRYWNEYVNCVENNMQLPFISHYMPICSEEMLNEEIDLTYKNERKTLFANKIFVFLNKKALVANECIITTAGGQAVSVDALTKKDMLNSPKEYIVIHDDVFNVKNTEAYNEVMSYVKETKTRTIPLQEIALALVHYSCKKHCNPRFDRQMNLLQSNIPSISKNILAAETQSQDLITDKRNETLHDNQEIFQTDDEKEFTQPLFHSTLIKTAKSVKRPGSVIEQVAYKKKKIETQTNTMNLFSLKSVTVTPNDKENIISMSPSIPKQNQNLVPNILNKRKLKEDSITASSKKRRTSNEDKARRCNIAINPFFNILSSVQSKPTNSKQNETQKDTKNPFLNILNTLSSSNKKSSTSSQIDAKPKMNCLFVPRRNKFQNVTVIDKKAKDNYKWLVKSDLSSTNATDSESEHPNSEMKAYIDSFKNAIVVKILNSSDQRPQASTDTTCTDVNFKKFKKVQPLHPQTEIISNDQLQKVVCGENEKK